MIFIINKMTWYYLLLYKLINTQNILRKKIQKNLTYCETFIMKKLTSVNEKILRG